MPFYYRTSRHCFARRRFLTLFSRVRLRIELQRERTVVNNARNVGVFTTRTRMHTYDTMLCASGGERDAVQETFEIGGDTYRDDLGIDWHRAVVAIDARVDVVGPRRGSCVKRGMKRQESRGAAVTAHWRWCHLTPVIIIQHPATRKLTTLDIH